MKVRDAKSLTAEWIAVRAPAIPGFSGAFLHGSIVWAADNAELSPGSDIDLLIVLAGPLPAHKPGKIEVGGLLLDVTYIDFAEVATAEAVLSNYHLAGSLRGPSILLDPTGHLTRMQTVVARDFAKREWVLRRCEDARGRVLRNLATIEELRPFHENVTSWLFGTGVTTHILLVAGLRNPTVRKRYEAVRDLLADFRRSDFYEELLTLLGCQQMTAARAFVYLDSLGAAFDEAAAVVRSPFFFASDISPAARSIAIDGTRDVIARGSHREAVFWLVATYARCLTILASDAPDRFAAHESGFRTLMADLDIASTVDLLDRAEAVRDALPKIWQVAEEIIDANPAVDRSPRP